ncbi:MAG: tetratricopeptide repeat protein [Planctomycetota bacterium]|nr:tetratricopeptide repeat protein [Planctomycetota bacterium]
MNRFALSLLLPLLALGCVFASPAAVRAEAMNTPSRLMDFADGLFNRGVYDLAAREYSRLLDKYPDFERIELVRFRRGECDLLRGRYEQAVPFYEAVLKADVAPDLANAATLRLGTCHYYLKDFEKALSILKKLESSDAPEHYRQGAAYFIAKTHEARDELTDAVHYYEKAAEGGDYTDLAAYARAKLAVRNGKHDLAVKYFRRVVASKGLEGMGIFAASAMADSLKQLGKLDEAADIYLQLVNLESGEHAFPSGLKYAALKMNSGQHVRAVEVLKDLVSRFPRSPYVGEAYIHIGRAFAALETWDEAADAFRRALEEQALRRPRTRSRGRLPALSLQRRQVRQSGRLLPHDGRQSPRALQLLAACRKKLRTAKRI